MIFGYIILVCICGIMGVVNLVSKNTNGVIFWFTLVIMNSISGTTYSSKILIKESIQQNQTIIEMLEEK